MKMQKKRYVLKFPPQSGDQPFSYHLVKDFGHPGLTFFVLKCGLAKTELVWY